MQLALDLPPPRARRRDPDTSKAAAARAKDFAESHHGRIHAALESPGTIYEIAARCGMTHVQVARRMPERLDLFEPTDERREGCRVWRRKVEI